MIEQPKPPDSSGEELPPAEKEHAESVGRELHAAGEQLEAVDPAGLTIEQFNVLEAKVDMIIGILAAYAGVRVAEFGFGISSGVLTNDTGGIELMARCLKTAALAVPGMYVICSGAQKFLGGLSRFAKMQLK